jgi:hypothetical protein
MRTKNDSFEEKLVECMEPLVDSIVALEKRDANSLIEHASLQRLEAQATAVRDHCAKFLYTRTSVEAGKTKELPAWLR